jgi:hypothetical protein
MPEPARVKMTVDGDLLELMIASREDQRWLVGSFLARHSP